MHRLFRNYARSTTTISGDDTSSERSSLFFRFFCPLRSIKLKSKLPEQAGRLLLLPPDEPIEEETCPGYNSFDYFPANPGDVFDGRYEVIAKIGWGGSSTVWLARDVTRKKWCGYFRRRDIWHASPEKERFVTLKINNVTTSTSGIGSTNESTHERDIEKHIARKDPLNPGLRFIRTHIDSFEVKGPQGNHLCLVYEPMREPVWLLRQRMTERKFSLGFVKDFMYLLLLGIDYLHTECRVVHTDLKLENILIAFENPTVIKNFVRRQTKTPMQRKAPDASGRTVYLSHNNFGPLRATSTCPKITDFGHADRVSSGAFGISPIQPDHYRAPEVILGCGWTYSADIWNLGLLIWNLLEGKDLFRQVHDDQGQYDPKSHLAEMIALFGPPPRELLDESEAVVQWKWMQPVKNDEGKVCRNLREYYGGPFFDKKGRFLHRKLIPARKLEETLPSLTNEERNAVLTFVRKMLQWLPEERRTARELLGDAFFHPRNINTS